MATLPIILPAGTVAVYGVGDIGMMPSGAIIPTEYRFGTIYNIWDGGAPYVYGGDIIYWKETDTLTRLATSGGTYTIVPARLATQDYVIP